MAYAHYWRRAPELNRNTFLKFLDDVRRIFEVLAARGVQLAGPLGKGSPELSDFTIAFNGKAECGHRFIDLGSPWPAKDSEGIEAMLDPVVGPWTGGALLGTRVCGGCCAAAPFVLDRTFIVRKWDVADSKGYSSACETNFKPYDLAVTAVLVRAKERLGNEIHVSSDGLDRGFEEAKKLCRELFGWAKHFELEWAETTSIV